VDEAFAEGLKKSTMKLNGFGQNKPAKIVTGLKANLISLRIFFNIFVLSIRRNANLLKGLRDFRKIGKRRTRMQGYDKIPRFIYNDGRYHWAEQIAGWPSSKFNRFFEGELIRCNPSRAEFSPLNTAIFSITSRCSLQCSHCFDWDNLSSEEHLNLEKLLEILRKLEKLELTHIQFSGGEPLARFDDLTSLVKAANPLMDCWILTSGFGLTSEKAIRLKKAGLTGACISLDHWNERKHNDFRNNNKAYFWAKEAAKNCREAGIIFTLSLCATKDFVSHENILRYHDLAKSWGASFIKILEPRQTGRFKGKDVKLDPAQIEVLMDFYKQSYSDKRFNDHPIVMYPGFDQRQVGCLGAGNRYLYIDSYGEIHSCPFCHGSAGNALEVSLLESIAKLRQRGCKEYGLCTSD
jgi:MoaA/NifB/PqqE/SkfB family radical SAM enzyme